MTAPLEVEVGRIIGAPVERKEDRAHMTAKQDATPYKIEPSWVTRKFELLNEPHKKIVLEIVHALLRLEGKQ